MGTTDSTRLHTAARRYLSERYDELSRDYAALGAKAEMTWSGGYTPEAKRIFPRYNVIDAILEDVERLHPDHLPAPDALATALVLAADTAQSPFTSPPQGKLEAAAIRDERRLFHETVRGWMTDGVPEGATLGYRRVLGDKESAAWRVEVEKRWGISDLTWHPMLAPTFPDDVLVLREASMWDGPGTDHVREALRRKDSGRITELREFGPSYLIDVDLFAPRYTGPEGVWSDASLEWIAYASHEGTVSFGGTLATALPEIWPGITDWRWTG